MLMEKHNNATNKKVLLKNQFFPPIRLVVDRIIPFPPSKFSTSQLFYISRVY